MIKILKYLKPYWKAAILAPILMFIEVISDLMQPTFLAAIVDKGIAAGDLQLIAETGLKMIGIAMIGFLGGFGCVIASSIASQNLGADLRLDLFQKVQSFSFANLDKFKTSSLVTRLTNDVMQIQNMVLMMLRIFVRAPLLCIGGIIMAVRINMRLAAILLVVIPVVAILLVVIINRGFPLFVAVQKRLDRVNAVVQENLSGIRVVKAYLRSEKEKERFREANKQLRDINLKAFRTVILTMPAMMLVINLSIVAVIWFGGIHVSNGSMHVGQVMAFITYMTQILFSLLMVSFVLMMFSRAKASADRINDVLETDVDIKDAPGAVDSPVKEGRVEFKNVSFCYENSSAPVLSNITFTAEPGETIAILGSTGSGKSTLVSLIPRLYDPTEGSIFIDGIDVREYKLDTLRSSIGVVLQDTILFTGSIKDNIKWGKEEASDEEIIEAAKAAQAHDFIMSFPEGYDTQLGQMGVNLSGGQKQRLAIARALIKKPAILILDDSTSAVDLGTEARIHKAIKEFMKNATCFVIAQRVSSVMDADKIIILDGGRIEAVGTHEELMEKSPTYQDIYRSQIREEEGLSA
jgi:ATP-binding cassette subfamily B protein